MKHLKRKALRLLPVLALPLCLALVASRARSAAEFPPPCKDDSAADASGQGKSEQQAALPATQKIPVAMDSFGGRRADGAANSFHLRVALARSETAAR
jgi:hypothetical protein